MAESVQRPVFAVCGMPGSFSDEAARQYLDDIGEDSKLHYAVTAEATFKAVESGRATEGIVPLSNTKGGAVDESVKAMGGHVFRMIDVVSLDVRQNLLVRPGETLGDVRRVVSHPQAILQCTDYLAKHLPKVPTEEYADTAKAAKDLADGTLPAGTAVIASRAAAVEYDLEIAAADTNDMKPNVTSFLVFAAKA